MAKKKKLSKSAYVRQAQEEGIDPVEAAALYDMMENMDPDLEDEDYHQYELDDISDRYGD
jgi:hypothetical protein